MSVQKYSRQREAVRANLNGRYDHPTAEMVYYDLRKDHPNISLGTVYRNLSLLHQTGEIKKISTENGTLRFDANTEPHDHFICRRCGRVMDIETPEHDCLGLVSGTDFKGKVEACEVTFYGLCPGCSLSDGSVCN